MPVTLFGHLTWTTWERLPMIRPLEARFLSRFLPAEAARHGAETLALGLVAAEQPERIECDAWRVHLGASVP